MSREYRCTTCDGRLRGRAAVRRHWLQFDEGHSVYEDAAAGTIHHQTIEGLHRRNWETSPPTDQPQASPTTGA